MRWCLADTSPSARERGRDNDPHIVKPEEVHANVEYGTVMMYFFEDTEDEDFPNPEKHKFICGVQFWEGWINQIQGGDHPIFETVHKAFLPYKKKKKPTSEQIVQALQEIEAATNGNS